MGIFGIPLKGFVENKKEKQRCQLFIVKQGVDGSSKTKIQKQQTSQVQAILCQKRLASIEDELNLDIDLHLHIKSYQQILGHLNISPFNFTSKVVELIRDNTNGVITIKFSPNEIQKYTLEQIECILSQGGTVHHLKALQNIQQAVQLLEARPTFEDPVQQVSQEVDLPFMKLTYQFHNKQSRLCQMEINDSILDMIGVTFEMLLSNFSATSTIPDFLSRNDTVEVWNVLFEANLEMKDQFTVQIQTFEGAYYNCQIFSTYEMIKVSDSDGELSYYYVQTWQFQLDDFLKKALYQQARLQKNNAEYFNLPEEDNKQYQKRKFEELTFQRPVIKHLQPCGYKFKR